MMTSLAFILGVLPLVVSEGAGAEMRKTLGTAVFSGMLGVTLFGIFLTPVFYFVIQWISDRRAARNRDSELADDDSPPDFSKNGDEPSSELTAAGEPALAQSSGNGAAHGHKAATHH